MAHRDRQVFDVTELPNGITIYGYPTDDPFVIATITVPVGTAHNTGEIASGSFHFLEHCLCNRSAVFPKLDSFSRRVGELGGGSNATTSACTTEYWASAPVEHFAEVWRGLFARAFTPLFDEGDLPCEREVILTERARLHWWPASSELAQYVRTRVVFDQPFSLRQVFGDVADLAALDSSQLASLHRLYFQPGVFLTIGGSYTVFFDRVVRDLAALELSPVSLPVQYQSMQWVRKDFHLYETHDVGMPTYFWCGFIPGCFDWSTVMVARFLLNHLTLTYLGPFFTWLRIETGWAYTVNSSVSYRPLLGLTWDFSVAVPSLREIEGIRVEFVDRFVQAMNDQTSIECCVRSYLDSQAFAYQKLSDILNAADDKIATWGHVGSEADYRAALELCYDREYRLALAKRFFLDLVNTGELCAMPKRSS